jgi:uncharacterized protein YecE (DUF72 family)
MAEILIGTSDYLYHEWLGIVYPEGTKTKDYLACYEELFYISGNHFFYLL